MRFREVAARLNGISTPIFGVSWTPATPDVAVARSVLAFLEDRRVLYSPINFEENGHSISSVTQIRSFLTDVIGSGGISDEFAGTLRTMRGICRRFLMKWSEIPVVTHA